MRFYAELPVRRAGQLGVDLLVVAWVVVCVLVARAAHDLVQQLQGPAVTLTGAGEAIRDAFDAAARTAGGVPFVGEALAGALGGGTGAGESLATAGREQSGTVAAIAGGLAVGIVVLGAVPVLATWVVARVRYARAAGSAIAVRSVDSDLLALRALAHLPVRRLLGVAPDPAAAWRRGDPAVVARLAALELTSLGLAAPPVRSGPPG